VTSSEHLATVRTDYDAMADAYTAYIGDAFAGYPLNHVLIQAFAESGADEVARLVIAPAEDPTRGFPQAHLLARKATTA
jgi:hypothetical protein